MTSISTPSTPPATPVKGERQARAAETGKPRKQVRLGAHFPGVNNTTVWSDPRSGSHIDVESFVRFAADAERGRFDFLFLAEGLRLREQNGLIHDLDVVGRPDTFAILAALAATTDHLGLVGTINATFNEPYEVARQFATLDHLSGGRAGWNVVTSWDAFTGENFRRGGFLDASQRYQRAASFVGAARTLWDSWAPDDLVADPAAGRFLARPDAGGFAHHDEHFSIAGRFNVPAAPQGHPVLFQAGDSDEGREFAARTVDAIFTRHSSLEAGRAFYADVKRRLPAYGRRDNDLLILPGSTFIIGDTDAEAADLAHEVRLAQVSGQTALRFVEQVWNRDLSDHDPDGPLPDIDPDVSSTHVSQGRAAVRAYHDPVATAREWRELASAKRLSMRELVVEVTDRQNLVGSPRTVADLIDEYVQTDACDGFILVPHLTPDGLQPFVDKVVPLLQEKGVLRSDYTTTTLRGNLGLGTAGAERAA